MLKSHSFFEVDRAITTLCKAVMGQKSKKVRSIVAKLRKFYAKGDEITRYRVVTGIMEAECRYASRFLKKVLLSDASELVRHEAVFCIGEMRLTNQLSLLKKVLKRDCSPIVRHEAAIALASIGDASCVRILERIARDDFGFVASSAKYAIQRLGLKILK